MTDTPLSAISAAAADADLLERVIAAASAHGVENVEVWVKLNVRRIVSRSLNPNGDTMASVYEYARATYTPTPRPGENPAVVTDAYIRDAVAKAWTEDNPTAGA